MRRRIRLTLAAAIVPAIALTLATNAHAAPSPEPGGRIILVQPAPAERGVTAVKDTYIVELKKGVRLKSSLGVAPQRTFSTAVNGFSAKLTAAQLAELQKSPDVIAISQDVYVENAADTTQPNPPSWGIDRIDQRNLPLSNSFTYTRTGSGVNAYIIDSGVDPSHPNFGGRATFDFNGIDSNNTDCNGHGTHVAGTIGSTSYGIAKSVRLHGVKWLDCGGGGASAAIAAVDWVTRNAVKPAVANASWNFNPNTTLENSLRAMINSGVFLAASAGNTGGNSCDRLPRKIETALVTAATTSTDARASYSSTGACVDVYAPGSAIVSTLPGNTTGSYNGTSMATPHVAGVAALYLQTSPSATPATVKTYIETNSTPNVVSGGTTGGTVNRLLFSNGL